MEENSDKQAGDGSANSDPPVMSEFNGEVASDGRDRLISADGEAEKVFTEISLCDDDDSITDKSSECLSSETCTSERHDNIDSTCDRTSSDSIASQTVVSEHRTSNFDPNQASSPLKSSKSTSRLNDEKTFQTDADASSKSLENIPNIALVDRSDSAAMFNSSEKSESATLTLTPNSGTLHAQNVRESNASEGEDDALLLELEAELQDSDASSQTTDIPASDDDYSSRMSYYDSELSLNMNCPTNSCHRLDSHNDVIPEIRQQR